MSQQKRSSTAIGITLWLAQILLAICLIWGGATKLFQPIESLSNMWPWTGQLPVALVRLTGLFDLLGATGLILPSALRVKSKLTSVTALAVIVLMVCASIFHIARDEQAQIGINITLAVVAAFVVWGRKKHP